MKFAGYEYILKIGNKNLINLSLICIVHKLNNKTLHINHNFDYETKNLPYELYLYILGVMNVICIEVMVVKGTGRTLNLMKKVNYN